MLVTHWLQSCGPLRALAACSYPVCQHPHGSKLTTVVHTPTLSTSLSTPSLRHANHTWAQCAPHSGAPPASSHTSPRCEAASNSRYRHTCRAHPPPTPTPPAPPPTPPRTHAPPTPPPPATAPTQPRPPPNPTDPAPVSPSDEPLQHPSRNFTPYLGHWAPPLPITGTRTTKSC